eukprot:GILK01001126.1.p1 GENE.GILK01001126.1~~GILK01001126.1.p1  ORF type:complete len:551 (+),score=100.69 GILK01001126.1:49-1653(+)
MSTRSALVVLFVLSMASVALVRAASLRADKVLAASAPSGVSCDEYKYCLHCVKDPSCGWCGDYCITGTINGPLYGNCTHEPYNYNYCAAPCAKHKSCYTCTSTVYCGWCASTQKCSEGDANGPTSPWDLCPELHSDVKGYHAVVNAWNHKKKKNFCPDINYDKLTERQKKLLNTDEGDHAEPEPKDKIELEEHLKPYDENAQDSPFMKPLDERMIPADPNAPDMSNPPPNMLPLHVTEEDTVVVPPPPKGRKYKFNIQPLELPKEMFRAPTKVSPTWLDAPGGKSDNYKPAFASSVPQVAVPLSGPVSSAPVIQTPVLSDDFDDGMSKWTAVGDGPVDPTDVQFVDDPTGLGFGKVLKFTQCSDNGTLVSKNSYQSASGIFRFEFDFLGVGPQNGPNGGMVGYCVECMGDDNHFFAKSSTPEFMRPGIFYLPNQKMWRHYSLQFNYNATAFKDGIRIVFGDSCSEDKGIAGDALFNNVALYAVAVTLPADAASNSTMPAAAPTGTNSTSGSAADSKPVVGSSSTPANTEAPTDK